MISAFGIMGKELQINEIRFFGVGVRQIADPSLVLIHDFQDKKKGFSPVCFWFYDLKISRKENIRSAKYAER